MATYGPSLVANAFLYKARQSGDRLGHMKLQKLVFFMHAWSLAIMGTSFVEERPVAWPHGPVFESLYHELKMFGPCSIDSYLLQLNPLTGQREAQMPAFSDADFWGLLAQVWDRYSPFSALQLSALAHEKGGPWDQARNEKRAHLEDAATRSHYEAKLIGGGEVVASR